MMEDNRVNKLLFKYDYNLRNKNWSSEMSQLFKDIDMERCFDNMSICNIGEAMDKLKQLYCENWKERLANQEKLRT